MQVTQKGQVTVVQKFRCGHQGFVRKRGYRDVCPECSSFWDREAVKADFSYDDSYSKFRNHLDDTVGALKVRSTAAWLEHYGQLKRELVVCEVGFGGGHSLAYLQGRVDWVFGIEVIADNLQNAKRLGIPEDRLFDAAALPPKVAKPVDLWCFFDSFEHLPDPAAFMHWVLASSSPSAAILLIAPCADSLSERLLGRLWPHRVRDHVFHWSKRGISDFFLNHGFADCKFFSPKKFIQLPMVVAHLCHKAHCEWMMPFLLKITPQLSMQLNFGEQGVLLRRRPDTL